MARTDEERTLYASLGRRAARLRRERGWTQEKLAEVVGVEPVTISRWERGHRGMSVATLARLADALGIQLADLLDIEREPPEPALPARENALLIAWRALDDRDRQLVHTFATMMARS